MTRRYIFAAVLSIVALVVIPASAQQFSMRGAATQPMAQPGVSAAPAATPTPPPSPTPTPTPVTCMAPPPPPSGPFPAEGDDTTSSLGTFNIQVASNFVPLFYNSTSGLACPGFNSTTNILTSPPLSDPATLIGRSMAIQDGSNASPPYPLGPVSDLGGAPVGTFGTIVSESMLIEPPKFPCGGVSPCSSGSGTLEVHTQIESLHLQGSGAAVRAGQWYNSPSGTSWPPGRISPGEVQSQSGPTGTLSTFFPASSFFDVFVQVDMPACMAFTGAFPGGILHNKMPLVVKNNQVNSFPPQVVYLHDSTSIVPILFLYDNPPFWYADDILGYFLLVGHGVGQNQNDFNTFMGKQSNASCPIGSPPSGSTSLQPKSLPAAPAAASPGKGVKTTSGTDSTTTPTAGSNKSAAGGSGANYR